MRAPRISRVAVALCIGAAMGSAPVVSGQGFHGGNEQTIIVSFYLSVYGPEECAEKAKQVERELTDSFGFRIFAECLQFPPSDTGASNSDTGHGPQQSR